MYKKKNSILGTINFEGKVFFKIFKLLFAFKERKYSNMKYLTTGYKEFIKVT